MQPNGLDGEASGLEELSRDEIWSCQGGVFGGTNLVVLRDAGKEPRVKHGWIVASSPEDAVDGGSHA